MPCELPPLSSGSELGRADFQSCECHPCPAAAMGLFTVARPEAVPAVLGVSMRGVVFFSVAELPVGREITTLIHFIKQLTPMAVCRVRVQFCIRGMWMDKCIAE